MNILQGTLWKLEGYFVMYAQERMTLTNSTPALDTPPNLTGFVRGRFDGASLGDKRYMNINMYHNALTKQKKKKIM